MRSSEAAGPPVLPPLLPDCVQRNGSGGHDGRRCGSRAGPDADEAGTRSGTGTRSGEVTEVVGLEKNPIPLSSPQGDFCWLAAVPDRARGLSTFSTGCLTKRTK